MCFFFPGIDRSIEKFLYECRFGHAEGKLSWIEVLSSLSLKFSTPHVVFSGICQTNINKTPAIFGVVREREKRERGGEMRDGENVRTKLVHPTSVCYNVCRYIIFSWKISHSVMPVFSTVYTLFPLSVSPTTTPILCTGTQNVKIPPGQRRRRKRRSRPEYQSPEREHQQRAKFTQSRRIKF